MLVAELLVLDAIDQGQALATVDGFGGQFDELLRIALEVVQAAASRQDADDGASGELGAILQVGQQIRQLNIRLVQHHGRRARFLRRGDTRLADRDVGLAPLQPCLGNHRGLLQRCDAIRHQFGVIELHAVRCLVLDAVPQCLELVAQINGLAILALAQRHLPALIGILDVQPARHLAQHFSNLGFLRIKLGRQFQGAVLQRRFQ